ncbi:hypothetical protein CYY_002272 [Polysphondylium violaceum]|uniref:FNIP repeat-containing protein n=1 Tax=Polysphondylium violaceum TaxID=133409 RepID=A0A8J4PZM8_9MYCE|nr:hypothetical protein CYY_002272 [Polysphondylium violaceum]
MTDTLFYLVWRNKHIRKEINYNFIARDQITIRYLGQLEKNHRFLENLHKDIHVIYNIKDEIADHLYQTHKYKHLITHLIIPIEALSLYLDDNNNNNNVLVYGLNICCSKTNKQLTLEQRNNGFPASIKYISFTNIRELEDIYVIPESITSLELVIQRNLYFNVGLIPGTVKHLKFGFFEYAYTNLIELSPGVIPSSVTHLEFVNFSQPLTKVGDLPDSITYLDLSDFFDDDVHHLPASLTTLYMGRFSKTLSRTVWPPRLKKLVMGDSFNRDIFTSTSPPLPPSLTFLDMGEVFDEEIDIGQLPPNLSTLRLGPWYSHSLSSDLESMASIKHLDIRAIKNGPIPHNATDVSCSYTFAKAYPKMPLSVRHLRFDAPHGLKLPTGYFSQHITKLVLNYDRALVPTDIPTSVTNLSLSIPDSIHLSPQCIPFSVTKLSLRLTQSPPRFNSSLFGSKQQIKRIGPHVIPPSVHTLCLYFSHYVLGVDIPSSVTKLKYDSMSVTDFELDKLPASIKCLDIRSAKVKFPLPLHLFTPTLETIKVDKYKETQIITQIYENHKIKPYVLLKTINIHRQFHLVMHLNLNNTPLREQYICSKSKVF